MHVQIVTFRLKGMTPAGYDALCDQVAPAIARLPGLISKVWLADEAANTYGGVYLWEDRASMEAFLKTDLFRAVATNPQLAEITSRDFGVLEAPTRVTRASKPVAA